MDVCEVPFLTNLSFQPGSNATTCISCRVKYFSDSPTSGALCTPGYRCAGCVRTACEPGFFSTGGDSGCKECVHGFYASEPVGVEERGIRGGLIQIVI